MDQIVSKPKQPRPKKPRSAIRRRSCLPVTIKYLGMATNARLFDISLTGAAIDLLGPFMGVDGSIIRVECTELCFLEARVRWQKNNRIGVEFEPSTNAVAKVKAYFKYFHKEPIMKSNA